MGSIEYLRGLSKLKGMLDQNLCSGSWGSHVVFNYVVFYGNMVFKYGSVMTN